MVPRHLRAIIGQREFTKSLGVRILAEARRKAAIEDVRVQAIIDRAQRQFDAQKAATVTLTDAEVHSLALDWLQENERHTPIDRTPAEHAEEARFTLFCKDNLDPRLPQDDPDIAREEADKLLWRHGIGKVTQDSHQRLANFLSQAIFEYEKRLLAKYSNDHVTLNPVFAQRAPGKGVSMTFGEVVKRFRSHQRPGRAHDRQYTATAQDRLMLEVIKEHTRIDLVTREDARRFHDAVQRWPANATKRGFYDVNKALSLPKGHALAMAAKTQEDYLRVFKAVFRYAVQEHIIERSPAEGLSIPSDGVADRNRRLPFSIEHLRTIFAPEQYPDRSQAARFWIPLLGLFTGMRAGEMVQLYADDISEQEGIPVILVRDHAHGGRADQHLKNGNAARLIPVHAQLVKLGMLEFAASVRKPGVDAKLFPGLWATKHPDLGWSKWFARFLTGVGIVDKRLVAHSLRHNFRQALANAGVPIDRVEALGGWGNEKRSTEALYGGSFPVKLLTSEINKIDYGLDFSHLYPQK